MTERTIEQNVSQTLETVTSDRASRTVEDVIGDSGTAQIEAVTHASLDDLPQGYRALFTERPYLPDDVENMTDEYIESARKTHGAEDTLPSLLRERAFLAFRLSYDGGSFTVYEEREPDTLDTVAAHCNVDSPEQLVGCGVPVERRGDVYVLDTFEHHIPNYVFPDSTAAKAAKGVVPFTAAIFACVLGIFAGFLPAAVVAERVGDNAGAVTMVVASVAIAATLSYGFKGTMYLLAAFHTYRSEGQIWPRNPYAKNFDGWRDYLFG